MIQDIVGDCGIFYFLSFQVAKSMETSEHSMAVRKSSEEMLLHLEMYRPFS